MKNFKEELLYKKWFLLAVFMLLINDFFLKYQFHNSLTGKLSDFSGLFAFPYFMSLFTKRVKLVYIATFLFFVFWKTALSQSTIDFLNDMHFNLYRVVDYTDFIAFLILPISYVYRNEKVVLKKSIISSCIIVLITSFSFIATSQRRMPSPRFYRYEKLNLKSDMIVDFSFDKEQIWNGIGYKPAYNNKGYIIYLRDSNNVSIHYKIKLEQKSDSLTRIKLDSILSFEYFENYYTIEDSIQKATILNRYKTKHISYFEKIVVNKLKSIR